MKAGVSFYDFTGFLSSLIFADSKYIENSEQDAFAYHRFLKMESEKCFTDQNKIFYSAKNDFMLQTDELWNFKLFSVKSCKDYRS